MKWGHKSPPTLLLAAIFFTSACALHRPVEHENVPGLGRFEFRQVAGGLEGVVIGAPHGKTDLNSDRLAKMFSDRTGAGLAIAYGFKSKRLGVSQPVVRSRTYPVSVSSSQRGSVFKEYRKVLRKAAKGEIDLYIGVHRSSDKEVADRIEVATSGITFEEAVALKKAYDQIRDRLAAGKEAPRLEMVIEPLERISWRVSGVKHHGVLLIAEKGLNIRLPQSFSPDSGEGLYAEILSRWIDEVIVVLRENPLGLPQIQVKLMDLGRLEWVESRKGLSGVVIGAPHGSYDEYTAEMAKRVSYRTGIAAVIAKGFTPTEAGGWRINVNRPTEKTPYSEGPELHSQRAREIYRAYRDLVFEASNGDLNLYIDIHQYNTDSKIQVATVGISRKEASIVKMLYQDIRGRILGNQSDIPAVDLLIEPLEAIEIGAWAAKVEGILRLARKSMHFELPSDQTFATDEAKEKYTRIFAALLKEAVPYLLSQETGTIRGKLR